ncbi:MAG: class I SAM-dependent methyltransferase [Verrucomicrobiota bacterium]
MSEEKSDSALYWDATTEAYQDENRISLDDFHFGPLLPGDAELKMLPELSKGMRAFEPGAGAGQNSIFLAKKGLTCVASDISAEQVGFGKKLAEQEEVEVQFEVMDVDEQAADGSEPFDLIHSTYVLPFAKDPARVIRTWRRMLKPGGVLIVSTSHPLYAGEWLEVDEHEEGVFLQDYFQPPDDVRPAGGEHDGIRSRFYPVSTVAQWLIDAGFRIDRMLEPEPLPVTLMSRRDIEKRVPYYSDSWADLYHILARVPTVVLFRCSLPR